MKQLFQPEYFSEAMHLLSRLGVSATYDGFLYTAYAISLAVDSPDRLLSVSNCIYPNVAAKYNTSPDNVRKSIAKVRDIAWNNNPELLSELAMHKLNKKPGTSQFPAILAVYLICCGDHRS